MTASWRIAELVEGENQYARSSLTGQKQSFDLILIHGFKSFSVALHSEEQVSIQAKEILPIAGIISKFICPFLRYIAASIGMTGHKRHD